MHKFINMKTKNLLFIILLAGLSTTLFAQLTWTQKGNVTSVRGEAYGFSIGNYGYIGGGWNGTSNALDLNQWDQNTNTWTQKASFPSTARARSVGFALGTSGFVVGGDPVTNEVWEYSSINNFWTQKSAFPSARYFSCAFVIGNIAYVGLGANSLSLQYNDFYKYDPVADTWTAIAPFPGAARCAAFAFVINGKGYVGGGNSYNGNYTYYNDMYEYNPTTNSWTQKANLPGVARTNVVGLAINYIGYAGTGVTGSTLLGDWYAYNSSNDAWQGVNVPNSFNARFACVAFNIGNKAYIGTGRLSSLPYLNDFWEFTSSLADINESHTTDISLSISNGQLNVFGVKQSETISNIRLIDLSGKVIKHWKYISGSSYNVADLSKGMYLVQLEMATGSKIWKVLN